MVARIVNRRDQLRDSLALGDRDKLESVPEVTLQADTGLVPSDHYGAFRDRARAHGCCVSGQDQDAT